MTAPPLDGVSGERAAATVAALAGDLFAGRRVGSAGGAAARGWLVDQLTSLGADVGTQAFEVPSVPEVYRAPQVRWHNGIETQALTFGRDVGLPVASAELARVRQAPLAVVGRGDTAGCWAVVPHDMGLVEAYDHAGAAVGLLISRAVDGFGWQYTMLAGLPAGRLPVLGVESALHQRLLAAAGDARLRAWWEADAPVRRVTVTGANVHARLADAAEGVDLLLTAHYDGVGDLPGLRQPAAADNGSGVAVVLECARVLANALPAGVGLSVALLDGEETGAIGSAHHAARLAASGPATTAPPTRPTAWKPTP